METIINSAVNITVALEAIAIYVEIGILLFVIYGCLLEREARNILQKEYEYDQGAYDSAMDLIQEFLEVLKRRQKRRTKTKSKEDLISAERAHHEGPKISS